MTWPRTPFTWVSVCAMSVCRLASSASLWGGEHMCMADKDGDGTIMSQDSDQDGGMRGDGDLGDDAEKETPTFQIE